MIALSGSPIGGPGVDESKLPPADRAADGIGVVDIASGKAGDASSHSGQDPESFDISPDGKFLYVSNEDAAEMSVLDLAQRRGHRARQGRRGARGRHRAAGRQGRLRELRGRQRGRGDRHGDLQGRRADEDGRRGRARSCSRPTGTIAFIATENGDAVTVVDAHEAQGARDDRRFRRPRARRRRRGRWAPCISPDAQQGVRLARAGEVGRRHRRRDAQGVRTIENVGARPWGIGVSPDGRKLYTANGPFRRRLDRRRRERARSRSGSTVGGSPWGVAVAQAGARAATTRAAADDGTSSRLARVHSGRIDDGLSGVMMTAAALLMVHLALGGPQSPAPEQPAAAPPTGTT